MSRSERQQVERQIQREVRSYSESLTWSDRNQLAKNIWRLMERISDVMDLRDAMHLVERWARDNDWDVVEARVHVADCPACNDAYMTLKRGTDIEMIPITNKYDSSPTYPGTSNRAFSDEITIHSEHEELHPRRELSLPEVPAGWKSLVSGKELIVRAKVYRNGRASVTSVQGRGLSGFILDRATEMVESTAWEPARDYAGRPTDGYVKVVFRWP